MAGHGWGWKSHSKCGRRGDVKAKAGEGVRRQKIYAKVTRMRILLRTLIAEIPGNLYGETADFSGQSRGRSSRAVSVSQTYAASNSSDLSFASPY